jgi:hypothetical protein
MQTQQPRRRVKIRTCADYKAKAPEFIKLEIESDRAFLERIAPMFELNGYGALRSPLELQLYYRLKAATA